MLRGLWGGGGYCIHGAVVGGSPQPTFPSASPQLMWLLRELVKSGVLGADGVCMTFMKQIAGELSRPGRRRYARTPCSQQPGAEMEP